MSWRLFLAVETAPETRERLAAWIAGLRRECPGWRWVAAGNIHLTVRFFGETPADRLGGLCRDLGRLALGHPQTVLRVAGWGCFPNPRRPRVLWAGMDGPTQRLAALAGEAEILAREHAFAPEERAFNPHLTVARAARQGPSPVLPPPGVPGQPVFGPLAVRELVLFRSHLEPQGSRYEVLERFPLAAGEGTQ